MAATTDDPIALFEAWMAEAAKTEPNDPNAVCLATATPEGLPSARMVLLKGVDARRSVRVEGAVESVSDAEADAYYASRARTSRLGAWASKQSRPLESRFALEKAVAEYGLRYAIGEIPRPPHWSGFRVTPLEIEFWVSRPFRLHDRVVFRRGDVAEPWHKTRLFP